MKPYSSYCCCANVFLTIMPEQVQHPQPDSNLPLSSSSWNGNLLINFLDELSEQNNWAALSEHLQCCSARRSPAGTIVHSVFGKVRAMLRVCHIPDKWQNLKSSTNWAHCVPFPDVKTQVNRCTEILQHTYQHLAHQARKSQSLWSHRKLGKGRLETWLRLFVTPRWNKWMVKLAGLERRWICFFACFRHSKKNRKRR